MARRKPKELVFPFGGYDRSASFQRQPPYTSSFLLNVLPKDPRTGRERGASRPGLVPLAGAIGSGNAVRFIASRPIVAYDGEAGWEDTFDGDTLRADWSAATHLNATLMPSLDGYGTAYVSSAATPRGMIRQAISNLSPSASVPYTIGILISPYQAQHGGTYYLFLRMDNTTPVVTTEGILVTVTFHATSGAYSGTLKVYKGGAEKTSQDLIGGTISTRTGWLKAFVYHATGTAETRVVVKWAETSLIDYTTVGGANTTLTGTRVGWGANCTTANSRCQVGSFWTRYTKSAIEAQRQDRLVASAGNEIWEIGNGVMTQVVTSGLSAERDLYAEAAGESLYIADYAHLRYSTTGVLSGGVLDDAGVTWNTLTDAAGLTIGTGTHRVEIISPTASAGTYAITNIHATNGLTLAHEVDGAPADAATVTYKIARSLKVYNGSTLTAHVPTITNSDIPLGCPLMCFYMDRLVLAGPTHLWFMSRMKSYGDFDYSQTDVAAARYASSGKAGAIGEQITALIPGIDDYLIFGCPGQLWILRGDIGSGGTLDNLSRAVGIVGSKAWCRDPSGAIYFLSVEGVYVLAPGGNQGPILVGNPPDELKGKASALYYITMSYDETTGGVFLFLAPKQAADGTGTLGKHWWINPKTGKFFPIQVPTTSQPTALLTYRGRTPSEDGMIIGGSDGILRTFRREAETDDGATISSYVYIGPVGNPYLNQRVVALYGVLAEGSGPVTWALRVGDSGEAALDNAALNDATAFQATGTWTTGRNYTVRPRVRGTAYSLTLTGAQNRMWALEHIIVESETLGRHRKS